MSIVLALALAALLVALFECAARAAPPPGVDPNGATARWVSRWENAKQMGCCGITSDCRPTAIRPSGTAESGFAAWIDKEKYGPSAPDKWVDIPAVAFSHPEDVNPGNTSSDDNVTGVDWACWFMMHVRCAALGAGI